MHGSRIAPLSAVARSLNRNNDLSHLFHVSEIQNTMQKRAFSSTIAHPRATQSRSKTD
jgi:hypothetical protein